MARGRRDPAACQHDQRFDRVAGQPDGATHLLGKQLYTDTCADCGAVRYGSRDAVSRWYRPEEVEDVALEGGCL